MKIYSLLSILVLILLFQNCKKKIDPNEKYTVTGTIYKNCNEVAANTTFYFTFDWNYGYKTKATIPFTTDLNGQFTYILEGKDNEVYNICPVDNSNMFFFCFRNNGKDYNLGNLYQNVTAPVVVKLKTNHLISNLDTIKFVFQYGNFRTPIYGPITKDTIIGSYTMGFNSNSHNNNPSDGEQKILWWNYGMPTSTNQTRVDYTIHGCASVADTAYIIVP